MPKKSVSRRKSLSSKKYKWRKKSDAAKDGMTIQDFTRNESYDASAESNSESFGRVKTSVLETSNFHQYTNRLPTDENDAQLEENEDRNTASASFQVSIELLLEVKKKVELFLGPNWFALIHQNAIHVIRVCEQSSLTIQRSIMFDVSGSGEEVFVHSQPVNVECHLKSVSPPFPLTEDSVSEFVDRTASVVNLLKGLEVCSGYDDEKFKHVWSKCESWGNIDRNLYFECRYSETFRSHKCLRLVNRCKWRCVECLKLYGPLKRKANTIAVERPKLNTANIYLSEEQKLQKLKDQHTQLDSANRKNKYLRGEMQEVLKRDGVNIDCELSSDLLDIVSTNQNISPAQAVFLQQQIKASQKKNMAAMRWHPTMIRLALSLHINSPSAYELLKNTGMIKLPSSRTLFDYQQVRPPQEGVEPETVASIAERVDKFEPKYMKYFVLMADEMHISQNLIFQKSTGKMVGYTSLDEVDKEVKKLEAYLEKADGETEPVVASKVLTYMVKGVANGIKGVVGNFAVSNISVNQMYMWTWEVIGALERSNICVVAFVCDGFSVNRAFFKMHKPVVCPVSGVTIGTVNKAARQRILYFLSDVPHLLKTIRNCFLNSRSDRKKSRRKMSFKGKKISWDYIIKLYESKKSKCLRKSFKLNAMNVYPDSYARMKVRYAAQVLSNTVAQDLDDQNWDGTSETVNFIRKVNNWFDCLNGPHTSVGQKKRNDRLKPYTSENDPRFEELDSFLKYLDDWKNEAYSTDVQPNSTAASDVLRTSANEDTLGAEEEGVDPDEELTPASKRILAHQTLEGLHMSTRAFVPLVQFLIREGTSFINPRVFTQDPLEQHFSKIRAGQGGSNNPNFGQFLNRNAAIHVIGEMGVGKRRGNCGEVAASVEVTTEPLPKRKCVRGPKIKF